jgi:hypothetical protein
MTTQVLERDAGTAPGNWRAERRADRLLAEQIRRDRDEAARKARRADQDAADARREKRRLGRAAARAAARESAGDWASGHFIDLMFVPVIAVPAWLGWEAMTNFGHALYGPQGGTLPLLSEFAMWIFEFAIVRTRKRHPGSPLWPLYAGMGAATLLCAVLNFMHGLDGPIPGTTPAGPGPGVVYALISVSGLAAHQVVSLAGRQRHAAESAASADATAAAELAAAELAAELADVIGDDAAAKVAEGTGGDAAKVAVTLAADLAAARAERDRHARTAASLRLQLAGTRNPPKGIGASGNAGKNSQGDSPENPDGVVKSGYRAAKETMRECWDAEIAAGRVPTGADLNRAADKDPGYSLGRARAKEWRAELPAGMAGDPADDGDADEASRPAAQAVAG